MLDNKYAFRNISNFKEVFKDLPTPSFIIDEKNLLDNCKIIKKVEDETGAKILLAQKCFSNYDLYPLIKDYTFGTEASGLYEARLGYEYMNSKEVHVFCGAYKDSEFDELLKYADHIVFNSPNQLKKFGFKAKKAGKSIGIRINPECSTQVGHEIYDPCSERSRLGVRRELWDKEMTDDLIDLLDGIHFHTLCEQNSDDLDTTVKAVVEKFGDILPKMKWVNFGGGHHITRPDYDLELLKKNILFIKKEYNVDVYLEPGEAWALYAGYLYTEVLDKFKTGDSYKLILDSSGACHIPDVIELPYELYLYDSKECGEKYIIGGPTCLSGDVIGTYYFDKEINIGDKMLFGDMANYTMVKTNTFNGMPLPSIYIYHLDGTLELIKEFGYEDFRYRLGK